MRNSYSNGHTLYVFVCVHLAQTGDSWLLLGNISSKAQNLRGARGSAGPVCCLLHGGVFSCPLTAMHFSYSQHAAALGDPTRACSSCVVTKCKGLCLKDLWERVEWATGCQSDSSQLRPVLGHEQGLLEKSGAMAGPPAGSALLVESLWPDGDRCVRCTGLTYGPRLLTERWKACIWISDFLCDLPTSYFIS